MESVNIRKCQSWKASALEIDRISICQNLKVSEFESVRIRKSHKWKES